MTESNVLTWLPNSPDLRASVGCSGQQSQLHGGPTSQLTGLKESADNVSVPDTTGHLQRSYPCLDRLTQY